jgi:hypothetical protein
MPPTLHPFLRLGDGLEAEYWKDGTTHRQIRWADGLGLCTGMAINGFFLLNVRRPLFHLYFGAVILAQIAQLAYMLRCQEQYPAWRLLITWCQRIRVRGGEGGRREAADPAAEERAPALMLATTNPSPWARRLRLWRSHRSATPRPSASSSPCT